jgi:hypothetical protein
MAKKKKDTNKEFSAAEHDERWPSVHTNTVLTFDMTGNQLTTHDVSAIMNAALRSGMLRIHIEQFDDLVNHASHSDSYYATEVELDDGGACAMASEGDECDSEVHLVLCGDRGFVGATLADKPGTKKKAAKKK